MNAPTNWFHTATRGAAAGLTAIGLMNTPTPYAHAATAFSRADDYPSSRLDDMGCFGPLVDNRLESVWEERIDDLLRMRNLADDWDGEGTAAPHPALVDGAIKLCVALLSAEIAPPDRVHAGVNETVYFEWFTPSGYAEIEVVSPIEAECRWVSSGTDLTEAWRISLGS